MSVRETCYGCDYAFNVDELIELVDSQFPEGIKLCSECMNKGEGEQ